MASSAPSSSGPEQRRRPTTEPTQPAERPGARLTLADVVARSGRTAGPRLAELGSVAMAVTRARLANGASRRTGMTRSVAMWALMQIDEDIREVLTSRGLSQQELASVLHVADVPEVEQMALEDIPVEPELSTSVAEHLALRTIDQPVYLADLAAAFVSAGGDPALGALPGRLQQLGVDVEHALPNLNALASFGLDDYSGSVRAARRALRGGTHVEAVSFVALIQSLHPEYADGRFASVDLPSPHVPSTLDAPTTDQWLDRVRGLYDRAELARSRHQVLDGELLVLGLAELDQDVADALRQNGFLEALTHQVLVRPRRGRADRTHWSPDTPADTDLLGRESLATVLADRIRGLSAADSSMRSSFLVHLDGPWGAGKSTLMGFMARQLEPEFLVVQVNAWREQRAGVQWWTLLSALRREIARRTKRRHRLRLWCADLVDRLRASWVPFATALLVIVAALVGLLAVTDLDLTASGKTAEAVLSVVSLVSAAFAGVIAAVRWLVPGSRRSAQAFVEGTDSPMLEVGRLLGRTLGRARRPVVFMIDDLDRCDAEYLVEFLEVVQTLLRDAPDFIGAGRRGRTHPPGGPYVVVAADGRWIRASYEKHFGTFELANAPGRPLGYLFLEKIFQLHVHLPVVTATAREAFLRSLLSAPGWRAPSGLDAQAAAVLKVRDAVSSARTETEVLQAARQATGFSDPVARLQILGDAAVKFSQREVDRTTEHELAHFADLLEPNPRSMRLFVNTYGVLRSLRTLEETFVATGPLAVWTALEVRWPQLADQLRAFPEAITPAAAASLPSALLSVLAEPEVQRVVADVRGGPLTADLVRQCSGAG